MAAGSTNLRLQVLLNAIDRVSGPLKKIMGGSSAAAQAIKGTQGELKRLEATQRSIKGVRKLEADLAGTSSELQRAQRELGRLGAEMNSAENPSKQLTAALRRQGQEVGRLRALEEQQRNSLQAKNRALQAAGVNVARLAVHERELQTSVARANTQLEQQRARLTQLANAQARMNRMHSAGMKIAAHGAAGLYGGQRAAVGAALPIGAAMKFESAMADVRKVVDFETPGQFKQMSRDIQELSTRLPMTQEQIAQIVAAGGQSGVGRSDLLAFAEDAVKMGVAFDSTAEEAGQTMATWRTAFRIGQKEVVELADKINYLGNTGPANVAKISAVVNRIGALGEVGGLASGPIAALGATVAGMGVQEEVAATGIKNMILRLTAGESATKRQREVFKSLRLDAVQMAKAMQTDANGAILTVLRRIRALPKHAQNAALSNLFGTESIGAIAPLLTNLELLEGNFAKVADAQKYSGSMAAEYAARVDTAENATQLLKNTALVLGSTMGDTLLPHLKEISAKLQSWTRRAVEWMQANPGMTKALTASAIGLAVLVAVLGAAALAVGTLLMPLGALQKAFVTFRVGSMLSGIVSLAGKALPMLGNALLWIARLAIANPVIAILVGIAAVAFAIYRNWDTIGPWFTKLWAGITTTASNAWSGLKTMLADAWAGILGYLRGLWAPFQGVGGFLMDGLVNGLLGGLKKVGDTILSIGGKVVGWFKDKLGIRSPSRVFAQLGDYTMQGLAGGLERSQGLPLRQVSQLGGRLQHAGAGLALAAAAAPAVALDNRPPITPAVATAASHSARPIELHFHGVQMDQAQEIARQVRIALEQAEREREARSRSRLTDYD